MAYPCEEDKAETTSLVQIDEAIRQFESCPTRSEQSLRYIYKHLITICQYRPSMIREYAVFLSSVISTSGSSYQSYCLDSILEELTSQQVFPSKSHVIHFLLQCQNVGAFPSNMIIAHFVRFLKAQQFTSLAKLWFFALFAPSIAVFDHQLFMDLKLLFDRQVHQSYLPLCFIEFYGRLPFYLSDGLSSYEILLSSASFPLDPMSIFIHDDVEALRTLSLSPSFKSIQSVPSSLFICTPFMQTEPSLLECAAFYSSEKCFKYLLLSIDSSELSDESVQRIATHAVAGGSASIISIIAQFDADISKDFPTSIEFRQRLIQQWIFATSEPTLHFTESIIAAAKSDDVITLRMLLGIQTEVEGLFTPLHAAARFSSLKCIQFLLDRMLYSTRAKDEDGMIPLHHAVIGGDIQAIKLLYYADPESSLIEDDTGDTPISLSIIHDRVECIKLFATSFGQSAVAETDGTNVDDRVIPSFALFTLMFVLLAVNCSASAVAERAGEAGFFFDNPITPIRLISNGEMFFIGNNNNN